MTVTATTVKSGPYNGNGSTDEFDYDFRVNDKTHLLVIHTDEDAAETTLTVDVDYTVNNVGNENGGTITVTTPPATGEKITIKLNQPLTQDDEFTNQGPYLSEVTEARFDYVTRLIQQVSERVDRAVVVDISSDTDPEDLIDELTQAAADAEEANIEAQAAAEQATEAADSFTALYYGPLASEPTERPNGDPSEEGDLYFDTVSNVLKVYNGTDWDSPTSAVDGINARYEYTVGVGGEDTFAAVYNNSDNVLVYLNGVLLESSEYDASSNTEIVLDSPAVENDVVLIIAYSTVSFNTFDQANITNSAIRMPSIRIGFKDGVSALTDEVVFSAPIPITMHSWRYKTSTGTCAVTLKKNSSIMTGASGVTVDSTVETTSLTANNVLAAGDEVKITIASISGAEDLEIWLDATWDNRS